MKKTTAFALFAAAAAFCSLAGPLQAGTLTLDPGSPQFLPPEAFTNNTIAVGTTGVDSGLVHISGSTTVTPPATDNMAQVEVSGMFSADAGDKFSVAYRFAADLNTTGPVSYTLSGTINGVPLPDLTGTIDPGLHVYEGTAESPVFPLGIAGNFSGTLTLDFTNAGGSPLQAAPGTLDLTVQQLDFQLGPEAVSVSAPSEAQNISTRANVGTGENVLIGGFIITGTDEKQVVLRGRGPSLALTGQLEDPMIELHDQSGAVIGTNDNWGDLSDADKMVLMDNGFTDDLNDSDSALVETLAPGQYTVILSGVGDTTGIGLVEIYQLSDGAVATLGNISSRGFVDIGDNVMIAGIILGGGGGGLSQVVLRGIGPSLTQFGVQDVLQDPMIDLHNENGDSIATNDNWMDDPNMQQLSDAGLAPTDPNEAALYEILPAGAYTAILSGVNDTSGVGLVEAYEIDPAPGPAAK